MVFLLVLDCGVWLFGEIMVCDDGIFIVYVFVFVLLFSLFYRFIVYVYCN